MEDRRICLNILGFGGVTGRARLNGLSSDDEELSSSELSRCPLDTELGPFLMEEGGALRRPERICLLGVCGAVLFHKPLLDRMLSSLLKVLTLVLRDMPSLVDSLVLLLSQSGAES